MILLVASSFGSFASEARLYTQECVRRGVAWRRFGVNCERDNTPQQRRHCVRSCHDGLEQLCVSSARVLCMLFLEEVNPGISMQKQGEAPTE